MDTPDGYARQEKSSNNFDFLRLTAAFFVIISHSFYLTGYTLEPLKWINNSMGFGNLAVAMFFIISGYLITKSWIRNPSPFRYLWSRLLRIVPGLAGVVLLTVFILGPLVTALPLKEYLLSAGTWLYLKNISIYDIVFYLPGVFLHNPYRDAVNGSLWTLPMEFTMYLAVLALGLTGLIKNRRFVLFITLASVAIYAYTKYPSLGFSAPLYGWLTVLGFIQCFSVLAAYFPIFFLMGATFFLYRDAIRLEWAPFLLLSALWLLSLRTPYTDIASFFCLPYLVLYLAFYPTRHLKNAGRYGDFSYGLYIYAFPVQQSLAYAFPGISPAPMLLLTVPATLLLAIASWKLIESRALAMKGIDLKVLRKIPVLIKNRY
jgi:peptidoglycan/LPS O-acetylase OafA/YrhL